MGYHIIYNGMVKLHVGC